MAKISKISEKLSMFRLAWYDNKESNNLLFHCGCCQGCIDFDVSAFTKFLISIIYMWASAKLDDLRALI